MEMTSALRPAFHSSARPCPLLHGSAFHNYRRSTTCKAPRKRSFIASMSKTPPSYCEFSSLHLHC